jgi:hypothetical protein
MNSFAVCRLMDGKPGFPVRVLSYNVKIIGFSRTARIFA